MAVLRLADSAQKFLSDKQTKLDQQFEEKANQHKKVQEIIMAIFCAQICPQMDHFPLEHSWNLFLCLLKASLFLKYEGNLKLGINTMSVYFIFSINGSYGCYGCDG